MYFLLIGIVGLVLKYFHIGPIANLSWWIVLVPFLLAMAWWSWADYIGYTQKVAIKRMDKRRLLRINKQRKAIGMPPVKR